MDRPASPLDGDGPRSRGWWLTYGALAFGLPAWIAFGLWTALERDQGPLEFFGLLALTLPIWLAGGLVWGALMHAVLGARSR